MHNSEVKTAADWLEVWDSGEAVWSVEMGGIGPGYEQAIQVTAAEMLRFLLKDGSDPADWQDEKKWEVIKERRDAAVSPVIKGYGLSGAQWGAAGNLSSILYRRGPDALDDDDVKDRRILVSKSFPHAVEEVQ